MDKLTEEVKDNLSYILGTAIGLAVLQVSEIITILLLFSTIKGMSFVIICLEVSAVLQVAVDLIVSPKIFSNLSHYIILFSAAWNDWSMLFDVL